MPEKSAKRLIHAAHTVLVVLLHKTGRKKSAGGERMYWFFTGETVLKNLRSSAICLLVSAAIVIGIQLLSNGNESAPLGILLFVVQVPLLLAAVVALFIFLSNLTTYFSIRKDRAKMGEYRKMADKNMPVIYRLLRYFHLWEKQTGKKYEAVALMQKDFDAYLDQYYLIPEKKKIN